MRTLTSITQYSLLRVPHKLQMNSGKLTTCLHLDHCFILLFHIRNHAKSSVEILGP